MIAERKVFIEHVVKTVQNQLKNHGDVIVAAEFSPKVYQDILMFLPEIKQKARNLDMEIEEDVVPNALLALKKHEEKKDSKTTEDLNTFVVI